MHKSKNNNHKKQELYLKCIKKYFFSVLPEMNTISKKYKKQLGGEISQIGIEKSLESVIELFQDGDLQLICKDENNFTVLMPRGDEVAIMYSIKNGEQTNELTHKVE